MVTLLVGINVFMQCISQEVPEDARPNRSAPMAACEHVVSNSLIIPVCTTVC